MAEIRVNFENAKGTIKPMHGVGQPPFTGVDCSLFSYLKEANIPYSRLHDVGGAYGGNLYVDIPNLFRDFDADPENPDSYDFAFTDLLIGKLVENGVEPFFRLGVTIENFAEVKAYRIFPPKSYLKWAKICEGIIRHYTEGWADGFNYKIKYWEIWNEPDNFEEIEENQMWRGTKEEFYEFYDVAATYLKTKFPHLKIGGYASCGFYSITKRAIAEANSSPRYDYFVTFFDGFVDYIKAHNSPLDFFSWHSYGNVADSKIYAEYARKRLDEAGYKDTETTCNEWNYQAPKRGTMFHAAHNTAMLIMMQHSPLDSAMFYDARLGISIYGGLFHPIEKRPYPLYYGFKAFGELYGLKTEAESVTETDNVYVLAATDNENGGILIVNIGQDTELKLEISGQTVIEVKTVTENGEQGCAMPEKLAKDTIYFIKTKK